MDLSQGTGTGDVSLGFTEDGGIERETEGDWRWHPEGVRDQKGIKGKERRRKRQRTDAAITGLPHISGCDFGKCS